MVAISPLLQQIILRLTDTKQTLSEIRKQRLGLVAIDELEILPAVNACIHSRHDPRLQRLVSYIVLHPKQSLSLVELSRLAGASVRTIERLFKTETGMTFRQWRSRFRLMNALVQLSEGESSTAVAYELGYKSVSSFIQAFKIQFGCTPQEYNRRQLL
ncbi:AraC family transcriptional regulator [uncultured Psychromonas sp.]|uniref:helix-turn-helix domain-containing protein n=1 Tax=uncultured Psychromonas sp. TaxID=173974 RepID=UPI002615EDE8|nr:AraC family transcriptional regulator [uncultured Psychromonas sp.]